MDYNLAIYNVETSYNYREYDHFKNYTKDMPDEALLGDGDRTGAGNLGAIKTFNVRFLHEGHSGIDELLPHILNHVAEDDRELFTKYIRAFQGMNFANAATLSNENYTFGINFDEGFASVGDTLQDINTLAGTDYQASGEYPMTEIRNAAVALLEKDGSERLLADVITQIGNFEQFMGIIRYAQRRDYSTRLYEIPFGGYWASGSAIWE